MMWRVSKMKLNIEANGETTRRILDFLAELEQDIDVHIRRYIRRKRTSERRYKY